MAYKMKYSGKELEDRLDQIAQKTDPDAVRSLIESALTAFDAPKDGKKYARKDGKWVEIE